MTDLRLFGVLLLVFAAPVWAQEDLSDLHGPLLLQCYEEADGSEAKRQCIGALSLHCMGDEPGGETTLGMTMCNHAESVVWDELLNDEYGKLMDSSKVMDEEDMVYFPEFANRAKALRNAQRAWITYRDANCELAYAAWGSGSMRNIANTDCIMNMTAERTIELRDLREMFE